MPVEAPTPVPGRPSAAEREDVVRRLRRGGDEERLSLDTFAERVELAYGARSRTELHDLVGDLPPRRRRVERFVERASSMAARVQAAWASGRTPWLELPAADGTLTFGRERDCDCVLVDPTVSRTHAALRTEAGRWWLRDLGSSNGTWVGGVRVL